MVDLGPRMYQDAPDLHLDGPAHRTHPMNVAEAVEERRLISGGGARWKSGRAKNCLTWRQD